MSLRIHAKLEMWRLAEGLWLDGVWGICSWEASQFGGKLMIYQLPDSGPKGMARLDLFYLDIFAPRLFCSSTLFVYRAFTTFWLFTGIEVQFPLRSYFKRRMKIKTESRAQWERRACANMCPSTHSGSGTVVPGLGAETSGKNLYSAPLNRRE